MIAAWRVSLRIGRDDRAPLTHEAVSRLSEVLADDRTDLQDDDPEAVVVTITVDARNEWEARSSAERDLRAAADTVWAELGLPPFTITFAAVVSDPRRPNEPAADDAQPSPRREPPARMPCPRCGSSRTQPFTHAGPAARVNMRCLACGRQFRDPALRR